MKKASTKKRFAMLEAGRALGDLSPKEEAEWEELVKDLDASGEEDISLDAIVGALEGGLSPSGEIPEDVTAKVVWDAKEFEKDGRVVPAPTRSFWSHPAVGWGIAAGLIILLGLNTFRNDVEPPPVSATVLAEELNRDSNAVRLTFNDPGNTGTVGTVLWSDERQQGVMLLRGIPANAPTKSQYQLWIVDSDRDDRHPVDGGVFDVPELEGTVAIRIDAKLPVDSPSAFVITEEQPGGVVVSKQEKVIAVAQL